MHSTSGFRWGLAPIFPSCVGSLLWRILTQASLKIIFLLIGCPLAIFPFWEEKVGVNTTHELGLNRTKLSPTLSDTAGIKSLQISKKEEKKNKEKTLEANKAPSQIAISTYCGESDPFDYPHTISRALHCPDQGQPGGNETRLKVHQ